MVEVWATPLPVAAMLAVPVPDLEPAELRGELLITVDTVVVDWLLFSLAASSCFCTESTTISSGWMQRVPLSSFPNRKNLK